MNQSRPNFGSRRIEAELTGVSRARTVTVATAGGVGFADFGGSGEEFGSLDQVGRSQPVVERRVDGPERCDSRRTLLR